MSPSDLYKELLKPCYDMPPYQRLSDMGEGMEIVKEFIGGYWGERFLINHNARTAYMLMTRDRRLCFVNEIDVNWNDVRSLENNSNAYSYSAEYQFSVYMFEEGVALVRWTLYPDGRFFMDEDGYGMEHCRESTLYGYIDRHAHVVLPFAAKSMKEAVALRPLAIENEHLSRSTQQF